MGQIGTDSVPDSCHWQFHLNGITDPEQGGVRTLAYGPPARARDLITMPFVVDSICLLGLSAIHLQHLPPTSQAPAPNQTIAFMDSASGHCIALPELPPFWDHGSHRSHR